MPRKNTRDKESNHHFTFVASMPVAAAFFIGCVAIASHATLLQGAPLTTNVASEKASIDSSSSAPSRSASIDSRRRVDEIAPAWLAAVGHLSVPGRRLRNGHYQHHREDCSATLVAATHAAQSSLLLTAWHCLELYTDLSKPLTFTIATSAGNSVSKEAYRVSDGGGMSADWAVLQMYEPISRDMVEPMSVHIAPARTDKTISMAGFSRDVELGRSGEELTYDPACDITLQGSKRSETNCIAYKGASGGAVVQLDENDRPHLVGIISEGDSEGRSFYVPLRQLRNTLEQNLR